MGDESVERITTDNIFVDLGFPADEAAVLKRKTILIMELETIVKRHGLSPTQAANRFGVSKSVMKKFKANDLDYFTIDVLIQMLDHAGKEVHMVVRNKKRGRAA